MNLIKSFKTLALGLVASAAVLLAAHTALADKILLKNGDTIVCEIIKEEADWYVVKVDGRTEYIEKANVRTVTRDEKPAEAKPAETKPAEVKPVEVKPEEKKPEEKKPDAATLSGAKKPEAKARAVSGATRVAILNFGPPSSWQGKIDNTVGIQINAKAWREAIPLLEKDNVDVVVVRINSGGGYLAELEKFHEVFQNEYKRKFRVVAWVESAISAAAMSPWVIEEFYMMPEGNIGACTGWFGNLQAVKGVELLEVLHMMERVSKLGKRDPKIMRAMQIQEPLSCNIDTETGNVTWFQDNSGQYLVNKGNEILTLNSRDAVKFKFAKAVAATPDELAKAMNINEVEWAGQQAIAYIDKNMRENDRADKKWQEIAEKYIIAISAAAQLPDRERRLVEVGVARRHLDELEKLLSINPLLVGQLPPGWMRQQRDLIKELSR